MDQAQFYSAMGIAWIFGLIVVSVVGWHLKSKRHMENVRILHAERMKAMEKGLPLPEFPEFSDLDGDHRHRPVNPRWPLGVGALLITGGLGVMFAFEFAGERFDGFPSFGLIPVFLGVGMFLFYALTRTSSAKR